MGLPYQQTTENTVSQPQRPLIRLTSYDRLLLKDLEVRVVLQRDKISIGCTDITVEAAEYILKKHKEKYQSHPDEVLLQAGTGHPC